MKQERTEEEEKETSTDHEQRKKVHQRGKNEYFNIKWVQAVSETGRKTGDEAKEEIKQCLGVEASARCLQRGHNKNIPLAYKCKLV